MENHVLPSPVALEGLEKVPRSDNYRCKKCGASIHWFESPNGRWLLLDIPESHHPTCPEIIRLGNVPAT